MRLDSADEDEAEESPVAVKLAMDGVDVNDILPVEPPETVGTPVHDWLGVDVSVSIAESVVDLLSREVSDRLVNVDPDSLEVGTTELLGVDPS